MKSISVKRVAIAVLMLLCAISAFSQIYRYYRPGTIWTVTMIRTDSTATLPGSAGISGKVNWSYCFSS